MTVAALAIAAVLVTGTAAEDTAEVLSLDECIFRGLCEGTAIRSREADLRRAREFSAISLLDLLPQLHLAAGGQTEFCKGVGPLGSTTLSAGLEASSVTVARGIINRQAFSASMHASGALLLQERISTAVEVTRKYVSLLLAIESEKDSRSSYERICCLRDKSAVEYEVGKISQAALAELDAQVASEKSALVKACGERGVAWLALAAALNMRKAFSIEPFSAEDMPLPDELPSEEEIERYVASHPSVSAARMELEAARRRRDAARVALCPDISVSAGYSSLINGALRSSYAEQLGASSTFTLGATLTVPILRGSAPLLESRSTAAEISSLAVGLEEAGRGVSLEIRTGILEAESSYRRMKATADNLAAMDLALSIAEAKFSTGAISGTDYTIARRNRINALAQYRQACCDYLFRMKTIKLRFEYVENQIQEMAGGGGRGGSAADYCGDGLRRR